jgi:hypothetical protein
MTRFLAIAFCLLLVGRAQALVITSVKVTAPTKKVDGMVTVLVNDKVVATFNIPYHSPATGCDHILLAPSEKDFETHTKRVVGTGLKPGPKCTVIYIDQTWMEKAPREQSYRRTAPSCSNILVRSGKRDCLGN